MLVALASCGEPTAPLRDADFVGTYVLTSAAGRPLPYVPPGATVASYYADYKLAADGSYTGMYVLGGLDTPARDTGYDAGTWRYQPRGLRGQDVVWTRPTGSNGLPLNVEFSYKVRDRGRTLVVNEAIDATPIDPLVYTRR